MATVTDVREVEKDFFLFLDAKTMTEITRVNFDESIPFTSHVYLHRLGYHQIHQNDGIKNQIWANLDIGLKNHWVPLVLKLL